MTFTPYVPSTGLSGLPTAIWSGTNGYPVLPYLPGQDVTVDKAPQWNTKVVMAASGRERRTAIRARPRWTFLLKYEVVRHRPTNDELFKLWEFFNLAQGMANPWLYVDPSDNYVTAASFGTGDGSTTAFQLARPQGSYSDPVYGAYSPAIYVNGTLKTLSTDYTIGANGIVTFTTAPAAAAALTWTGYYYFLCRFDQDDLTMSQIFTLLWSGPGMKFISIIP